MTEPFEKFLRQGYRLDRSQPVQSGRPFQIDDLTKVIVGASHGSPLRVAFELGGLRTMLSVPLVRDGVVFGRIVAGRQEVRPFSEHQIAVLQSFADQAVIAIENARLFNETQEALERQTATADILKVIASSPSDVQPVFEAIADSAKRLLGSHTAVVTRVIDGVVHFAAGTAENEAALHGVQGLLPYPLSSTRIHAKVARTGELAVSTAGLRRRSRSTAGEHGAENRGRKRCPRDALPDPQARLDQHWLGAPLVGPPRGLRVSSNSPQGPCRPLPTSFRHARRFHTSRSPQRRRRSATRFPAPWRSLPSSRPAARAPR